MKIMHIATIELLKFSTKFKRQNFRLYRNLMVLLSAMFLVSACGGGSSSSGSGGSGVGAYNGFAMTTVTLGGISRPANGTITIVVAANGAVTLNIGGFARSANRSGNKFSVAFPSSAINGPGLTCVGSFSFNGTIGSNITGTVTSSGNFGCNGISGGIRGTFTANRNAREGVAGADFASVASSALSQM